MAAELVLDASVSLAWFLKETPERAAYAAAVSAAAADGAILHVPVQWGIEMGHVLLRENRREVLTRGRVEQAFEDLDNFDIRVHLELFTPRRVVDLARRYHLQGYDALYFHLARSRGLPWPRWITGTGRPQGRTTWRCLPSRNHFVDAWSLKQSLSVLCCHDGVESACVSR